MSVQFGNARILVFIVFWLLSGTVLGLAGHFASIFLPTYHREFVIFAIVVPSLTIISLLLSVNWAQPWTEVSLTVVLSILWLAMGSWASDLVGHIECSMLGRARMPTKSGSITYMEWCFEMRVIQAFSWMTMGLIIVYIFVFISLLNRAQTLGLLNIWNEHISYVPWFGEFVPGMYMPQQYMGQYMTPGPYYAGGQSVVIQPNGAMAPTVTHYRV